MNLRTVWVPLVPADELRHLLLGAQSEEVLGGLGSYRFTARCPGGEATRTLARCREALAAVLEVGNTPWPADGDWLARLPTWFVDRCRREPTPEEIQRDREWWVAASYEERFPPDAPPPEWTALGWIHALRPKARSWWWWDASTANPDTLLVDVGIDGWPFGSGSLDWLLRAAGAAVVQSEEELDEGDGETTL